MKRNKLQRLLRELKQELSEIPSATDSTEDSLENLEKDIDRVLHQLEQSEPGELDHESLSARLRETVDRFEATHPTLTAIVNNILNTLAGSGV